MQITLFYYCKIFFRTASIVCLLLGGARVGWAQVTADQIFSALEPSVFQIRIIEVQSGSRHAIGTGFVVDGGWVASNYHVVSGKVLEPEKYRVEIERFGEVHELSVLAVDVVSDLAILASDTLHIEGETFSLADQAPRRGEVVYSLGNPHNLGMTVVQGNYNGLIEHKFLPRIHFSGAINPGMSGGPSVNKDLEVVGINVATAGNQIGFLVPVQKLTELLARVKREPPDASQLTAEMAAQIRATTGAMLDELLAADWPIEPLGRANILGETVPWMGCWGNSDRNESRRTLEIARGCNSADDIYITSRFNTGQLEYEFFYLEAYEWPPAAFYRHMARTTAHARAGNRSNSNHVGNYECVNRVVNGSEPEQGSAMSRRVSYCVRAYKQLPDLYDVFFIGVSLDDEQRAVMDHFTLAGVDRNSAQRFLARFVEVLSWQ